MGFYATNGPRDEGVPDIDNSREPAPRSRNAVVAGALTMTTEQIDCKVVGCGFQTSEMEPAMAMQG